MRFGGLVINTVVCLTLAKWETVSGQFGGYLTDTACHIAWTELGASAIVATSTNNLLLANTARLLRLAAQKESIDAFMMIGLALSVGIIVLVSLKIV
jgi:hypothetical protein